jgi:hypothetical protein
MVELLLRIDGHLVVLSIIEIQDSLKDIIASNDFRQKLLQLQLFTLTAPMHFDFSTVSIPLTKASRSLAVFHLSF